MFQLLILYMTVILTIADDNCLLYTPLNLLDCTNANVSTIPIANKPNAYVRHIIMRSAEVTHLPDYDTLLKTYPRLVSINFNKAHLSHDLCTKVLTYIDIIKSQMTCKYLYFILLSFHLFPKLFICIFRNCLLLFQINCP